MFLYRDEKKIEDYRRLLREQKIYQMFIEEEKFKPKQINTGTNFNFFFKTRDSYLRTIQNKGEQFELEVAKQVLCISDSKEMVISNFIFEAEYGQLQEIDIVYVTNSIVFIIEVKYWKGTFVVKEDLFGKKIGGGIYNLGKKNPLLQIEKQRQSLIEKYEKMFNEKLVVKPYIFMNNKTAILESDIEKIIFVDFPTIKQEIEEKKTEYKKTEYKSGKNYVKNFKEIFKNGWN
ncbi:hypothetical protein A3781_13210 [Bacillus badius]|nr:hypothetical protein A3781_13210 [Bacillus badius]